MKIALIATVLNEGEDVVRWAEALKKQTGWPDEFVIVDGGSTDGTPEVIKQTFQDFGGLVPRIIIEPCNIARGRNLAIQNTTADIIVSTDAGSYPDPQWLEEITRPLLADPKVDLAGGRSWTVRESEFQKFQAKFEPDFDTPTAENAVFSSSRNIAFRRETWASVGGYPEWLTLAAEDALFNYQLHALGMNFVANCDAVVRWVGRTTEKAYLRLLYRNAFGAAEAGLYSSYFLRRLVVAAVPPLLLLSRFRGQDFGYRYRCYLAGGMGWIAGKLRGHRPPAGWKRIDGVWMSPEAQTCARIKRP